MKKLFVLILFLSIQSFGQSIWWVDTTSAGVEKKVNLGNFSTEVTSGGLAFARMPVNSIPDHYVTAIIKDTLIGGDAGGDSLLILYPNGYGVEVSIICDSGDSTQFWTSSDTTGAEWFMSGMKLEENDSTYNKLTPSTDHNYKGYINSIAPKYAMIEVLNGTVYLRYRYFK